MTKAKNAHLFTADGLCRKCGRGRVQHGALSCAQIDAIREREEYYRLSARERRRIRKPS